MKTSCEGLWPDSLTLSLERHAYENHKIKILVVLPHRIIGESLIYDSYFVSKIFH